MQEFGRHITIEKPDHEWLEENQIFSWPVWTKEPSKFEWHYDETEQCYLLEGEALVKTAHEELIISKGDFVTFPKGLSCTWEVKSPIRKHYTLEE